MVDNEIKDIFLEEIKRCKGTHIVFRIGKNTKKKLKSLFNAHSNSDYEFDKTSVTIRLLKKQGACVSRSEAKRLLYGLEKFKRIVLDFKGIKGIGQGFADEVFRVFQKQNPKIQLKSVHMKKAVAHMVTRAQQTLQ